MLFNSFDPLQNYHDYQSIYKATKAYLAISLAKNMIEPFSWIPLIYSLIFNFLKLEIYYVTVTAIGTVDAMLSQHH